MPILAKTKTLHEALLRFGSDGALKGAHAQYLESITEDGVVISATPGPAIPLSLVDAADKPTLAAALGEATSALIAAKEAAEAEAAALRADNAAKEAAEAEAAALRAEAAAKDANIQTLLAEVEALRAAEKG
jgi:predicted transcriptional regulator of viral defense system